MPSALVTLASLAVVAACAVDEIDLNGKHCPCASGWVCDKKRDICVDMGASSGGASTGGASTGGASTGGASTGGASTGGASGAGGAAGTGATAGTGGVAGAGGALDAGADGSDGAAGCGASAKLCNGSCVAASVTNGCAGASCDPCPTYPTSSPTCTSGACAISCSSGYGDCDGVVTNGCETQVGVSDANNCGKCARTCGTNHVASTSCSGASCSPVCNAGYGNCNESSKLVPDDGCETSLTSSTSNCGRCGYSCSAQGGLTAKFTCFAGVCGCSTAAQCLTESTLTGVTCDTTQHLCVCGVSTCGAGETCVKQGSSSTCACNGVAKCNGASTCCASGCKNLGTDPANCGVCGLVCAAGKLCQTGVCI